jgi:AraC-like DNA-binding protein
MDYQESLYYKSGFKVVVGTEKTKPYYFLDYDERSFNLNMEFEHFHHFYEIFIALENNEAHIIEGRYYALKKYDMVLLRPNLLHKTKYAQGDPSRRLIINFSLPEQIPLLSKSEASVLSVFNEEVPIFRFPEEVRQELFNLLNEIFLAGSARDGNLDFYVNSRFQSFLWLLNNKKGKNLFAPQQLSDSIEQKIFLITGFIHNNPCENLSLEGLSKRFFISSCYLSHQFKEVTGFTLSSYVQMARIRRAQYLLLYTDKRINEIAGISGFTSFSQFNRLFMKYCHMNPSAFRKKGEPLMIGLEAKDDE